MIFMPFPWLDNLKGKGDQEEDYTGPPVSPTWSIMVPVSTVIAAFKWLFCQTKSKKMVKK